MSRFSPIRSKTPPEPEAKISPPDSAEEIQPEQKSVLADGLAPSALQVTLTFNQAKNGLQLHFPSKPDDEIRAELKAAGWRWSFRNSCWYHRDTEANRDFAERFVARLNRRDAEAQSETKIESQPSAVVPVNVIPLVNNANGGRLQRPPWRLRLGLSQNR